MNARTWWITGQSPWVKFVELFLVANAVAAVVSLVLAPGSEDWFTWTIVPDAAARTLAVMYANAVILGVLALRCADWAHARVVFVLITVFAVAATVMTLFTLDPFLKHPWYHLAYWLTGYAVLVVLAPPVPVWQERKHGGRLAVRAPLSAVGRTTAALAGLASAAAAVALLVDPVGVSDVWPWDITPLTGRLVGVWFGAWAVAWGWALWDGDRDRNRPLFVAAPVTGLLLALVPLLDSGDVRPDAGLELAVFYGLALLVAAPGLALLGARDRVGARVAEGR